MRLKGLRLDEEGFKQVKPQRWLLTLKMAVKLINLSNFGNVVFIIFFQSASSDLYINIRPSF